MNTEQYDLELLIKLLNDNPILDPRQADSLQKHLSLKFNYESNAIEGNSLTLNEAKVLLENGITSGGKPFKDHLDIVNHQQAISYLQDLVNNKSAISERVIKEFNYLLLKGVKAEQEAGAYRNTAVTITGSDHTPPPPIVVPALMEALVSEYNQEIKEIPREKVIDRIAKLHADFVAIHPFVDGNGRTGRLLMNLELLVHGYPIAIINSKQRADYYDALEKADFGNYEDIAKLIRNYVIRTTIEILNLVFPSWQAAYAELAKKQDS